MHDASLDVTNSRVFVFISVSLFHARGYVGPQPYLTVSEDVDEDFILLIRISYPDLKTEGKYRQHQSV